MGAERSTAAGAGMQRTAALSAFAALFLLAIKLAAGLASGSLGLIGEALHSGTDLVAALLTLFAVRVAIRPPDRLHPYGHGKAEHLAALAEAAFLVAASALLAYHALRRLISGDHGQVDAAWYALAVLGVVIAVDATRATLSWRAAQRWGSPALASNALHFASDLLGSFAVLTGLLLVRAGRPEGDAVAGLVVAALVVIAAVRLMRANVQVLMDRSAEPAAAAARDAIERAEPNVQIRRLRVREAAGEHFVDAVVGVRPDAALGQGHAVADAVEAAVRTVLPRSDIVIHVEPADASGLRARASAAALLVRGVREVHNVRVLTVAGRPEVSLHLKLPGGYTLEEAHDVTCRVEAAIRDAVPAFRTVHTHIEPLAESHAGDVPDGGTVLRELAVIRDEVLAATGREPASVRLRRDGDALVALLTIALDPGLALGEAHACASGVEERIRSRAPAIADVIIHTEPAAPA